MDSIKTVRQGSTCLIHPSAVVGSGSKVGEYTKIMEGARVGSGCEIGHNVVIHRDTVIQDNVRIDDHATVGKLPMKAVASVFCEDVELEPAWIGTGCLIGTSAILYRGCRIGDHVLIADQATVREQSKVGDFTIVGRGVAVESHVSVGQRCKIEAGAYVAGPSEIQEGCFIAPGVVVTNDNFMGRTEARKRQFKGIRINPGGRIGANATLLPGKKIGPDGVVAAGAVLTHDVPSRTIVSGVPARYFGAVPGEQLWSNQRSNVNGKFRSKQHEEVTGPPHSDPRRTRQIQNTRIGLFFDELAFEYRTDSTNKDMDHGC